jgi:ATP adenylyltransferase
MERLWTPWRREYVSRATKEAGCVFCRSLEGADARGGLVVHRTATSFVVMNLYPYTAGHVMVAPRRHVGTLQEASPDELAELMSLARQLERAFAAEYRPDGINVGMNLGRAAGAGVVDHIHLHVVPRWNGDANFMTVVGETRLIPEEPAAACARLRPYFSG